MNKKDYKMTQQEKDIYEILYNKYGPSLDIDAVSKVTKKSPSTLYRMRKEHIGPGYTKDRTKSENSAIRYPLHEIVRYLCDTQKAEEAPDEKC